MIKTYKNENFEEVFDRFCLLFFLGGQHRGLSKDETLSIFGKCLATLVGENKLNYSMMAICSKKLSAPARKGFVDGVITSVDQETTRIGTQWYEKKWELDVHKNKSWIEISLLMPLYGLRKTLEKNTALKTQKSIEKNIWERIVQLNVKFLNSPFSIVDVVEKHGEKEIIYSVINDDSIKKIVEEQAEKVVLARKKSKPEVAKKAQKKQEIQAPGHIRARSQGTKAVDKMVESSKTRIGNKPK